MIKGKIYLDKDHITYYLKKELEHIDWRYERPIKHIRTDAITKVVSGT